MFSLASSLSLSLFRTVPPPLLHPKLFRRLTNRPHFYATSEAQAAVDRVTGGEGGGGVGGAGVWAGRQYDVAVGSMEIVKLPEHTVPLSLVEWDQVRREGKTSLLTC